MRRTDQIWFFLTLMDEVEIAGLLAEHLPEVKLLDEWNWTDANQPPVRVSPADCSGTIGIWNSSISADLTGVVRQNGRIDGPDTGAVVQWSRCRRDGSSLSFGQWSVVYDSADKEIAAFVRKLWRILIGATTDTLMRTSGDLSGNVSERRFRAGKDAYGLATSGEIEFVADKLKLAPEPVEL